MNGVTVVRLGYQADPEKADPGWRAAMKVGVPADVWEREFEGNARAGYGLAIYGREYRADKHERPLEVDPALPVLHGWDFGRGCPAHVWGQRTGHNGLRVLASLAERDMQLRPFAERVIAFEINVLGGPFPNRRDFADPAGNQGKDDGLKSIEVLREFGWRPQWRGSGHDERHEYMSRMLLSDQPDGAPMVLVDPRHNAPLCEAFSSRYRRSKTGEPERVHPWIDLIDAFHYLVVNTKAAPRPRSGATAPAFAVSPISGYGRAPMPGGGSR